MKRIILFYDTIKDVSPVFHAILTAIYFSSDHLYFTYYFCFYYFYLYFT